MDDASVRVEFLYSAAHFLSPVSPALSRHAFSRLAAQSRGTVQVADSVLRRFCNRCGSLFAAGANCTVAVRKAKEKRRRGKKERGARHEPDGDERTPEPGPDDPSDAGTEEPAAPVSPSPAVPRKRAPRPVRIHFHDRPPAGQPRSHLPKRLRKQKNRVCYRCLVCGAETVFPGTTVADLKALRGHVRPGAREAPAVKVPAPKPSTPAPEYRPASPALSRPGTPAAQSPGGTPVSASQLKKARNKVKDLQSMVAKQKERAGSPAGGAKLEDFLAQLTK